MPIEEFIITVYCLVDSEFKNITKDFSLRSRGFEPKLSDSEVITMDIVGKFQEKIRMPAFGGILKHIGRSGFLALVAV